MLEPGRRTLATTYVPGRIVSGTFGPTSSTTPKFSCPMIRKSSPGGAAPYSAALISLSVPSTPTRRTRTRTPRPPGTSSTDGFGMSSRWIESALPGWTAIAFIRLLSRLCRLRYSRSMDAAVLVDESRVVRALREGDEAVFATLAREYHSSLLRVAQIYVPSRAVAEEVVQETWIGVLTGIERFEGRASLKTWIFRILTNIAKTRAQREGRTLPFSALRPDRVPEAALEPERFRDSEDPSWPGHWSAPPQPWNAPEESLLGGEVRAIVERAIEELPGPQRAVISLRDIEGWPAEEVCNALDVSETNQRVLLHRARSKVRRALEEYLSEAQ